MVCPCHRQGAGLPLSSGQLAASKDLPGTLRLRDMRAGELQRFA
jgi:hypothetical protein